MRTILVNPADPDRTLLRTGAPTLEATVRAPACVRDGATNEPLLLLARFEGDLSQYRRALRAFPPDTTMRMIGSRNRSRTFGYASRREVLRRYGCRACSSSLDAPEAHSIITGAATGLWETFSALLPERAAGDLERAQIIDDGWRMGGTPWTSGVVNFDSPLPYHFDANNLLCWSAMTCVRRDARGGHLHVPQLGVVVDCRDGDVLYFAGYHQMHAVTPVRLKSTGYRITAVYYSVAAMRRCQPPDIELAAARSARSEAEDTMLVRQRESGLLES